MSRQHKLVDRIVRQFDLNLANLSILTEAASGAYSLNPLIAASAGAEVYCVTKDSRFGSQQAVFEQLTKDALLLGLEDKIHLTGSTDDIPFADIDIVTNSGFVRPIDRPFIDKLKPECVIPLMWETWEFRDCDFDLDYCKQKGILCLGTDESAPPLDMDPYAGVLAVKMLFELNLELHKNTICLMGENKFAWRIYDYLTRIGCEVTWFAEMPYATENGFAETISLTEFRDWFTRYGSGVDAILLADLVHKRCYTDAGAPLDPAFLRAVNPDIHIGILAGATDTARLMENGIKVAPHRTMPAHFMSYQLYDIGPAPIMELYAAGLKVGAIMSQNRKAGYSPVESAQRSLAASALVMDFNDSLSWLAGQS